MKQQTKLLLFVELATIILLGLGYYFWKTTIQSTQLNNQVSSGIVLNQTITSGSDIVIMVPENETLYKQKMIDYVQIGGEDPLKTTNFKQKKILSSYSGDILKATAQAASEEIAPGGGGPGKATVEYFKVETGTAYVLLNIDINGWAGVSVSLATIHPIVEKSLLQFPQIKRVVFDYAPEDKSK